MSEDEYDFFINNHLKNHCIMGNDYYDTNEHLVADDGSTKSSGEIFGYNEITRQYYERYRMPVMHTETNQRQGSGGDEAVRAWPLVPATQRQRRPSSASSGTLLPSGSSVAAADLLQVCEAGPDWIDGPS